MRSARPENAYASPSKAMVDQMKDLAMAVRATIDPAMTCSETTDAVYHIATAGYNKRSQPYYRSSFLLGSFRMPLFFFCGLTRERNAVSRSTATRNFLSPTVRSRCFATFCFLCKSLLAPSHFLCVSIDSGIGSAAASTSLTTAKFQPPNMHIAPLSSQFL